MSMVKGVEEELPDGATVYGLAVFNGEIIAATSLGTFVHNDDSGWRLVEPETWEPVTIDERPTTYYAVNPLRS